MSKCSVCGAELLENSKFCPECGTPVSEPAKTEEKAEDKAAAEMPKEAERAEKRAVEEKPMKAENRAVEEKYKEAVNTENSEAETEKKKPPTGVIAAVAAVAVIVVIAVAVSGGGSDKPTMQTTVTLATRATTAETTTAATTSLAAETTEETTVAAETTTVTTTEETTTAETVPLLAENLVISPAHKSAMGKEVSCSFALSDHDVSMQILGNDMKIVADYSKESVAVSQNPVIMVVTIGDTEAEFIPDETTEESVTFYVSSLRRNLVDIMGFSDEDINELAFRSNGAPVDVERITIDVG